jgi:hypothetical protein
VRIGRQSQELPSWTGLVSYSIYEPPVEDEDEDEDSLIVRNWRLPPNNATDYAALAELNKSVWSSLDSRVRLRWPLTHRQYALARALHGMGS